MLKLKGVVLNKKDRKISPFAAVEVNGVLLYTALDENGKFFVGRNEERIYFDDINFMHTKNPNTTSEVKEMIGGAEAVERFLAKCLTSSAISFVGAPASYKDLVIVNGATDRTSVPIMFIDLGTKKGHFVEDVLMWGAIDFWPYNGAFFFFDDTGALYSVFGMDAIAKHTVTYQDLKNVANWGAPMTISMSWADTVWLYDFGNYNMDRIKGVRGTAVEAVVGTYAM